MKKITIVIISCFVLLLADNINAINVDKLIAYPVPFNPRRHGTMKVRFSYQTSSTGLVVKMNIYDINGDKVKYKKSSVLPIQWNGHNDMGNLVKPGFYIIKVDVEDPATGQQGKKTLRVLVNY